MPIIPSLSISHLNQLLKTSIETDPLFHDIWIEGEIISLKQYKLGQQFYVTLSDGNSQINAVIFPNFLKNITIDLKEGVQVNCRGSVKLFHKRGTYSFQIVYMTHKGKGELKSDLEKLKQKLVKEGLFKEEHKKEIPHLPSRIALITAPNSAALSDFTQIIADQNPLQQLLLVPAIMQGARCPQSIQKALQVCMTHSKSDLIVIMRGGGSTEDLSVFNDESIVRAIFNCNIPIISAIGHETDYTFTDFVSDKRYETPSAIAKSLAYESLTYKKNLLSRLVSYGPILSRKFQDHYDQTKSQISSIQQIVNDHHHKTTTTLDNLTHRLTQANPLLKFKLGYSITTQKDQKTPITSISSIKKEEILYTQLQDGVIESKVITKRRMKLNKLSTI